MKGNFFLEEENLDPDSYIVALNANLVQLDSIAFENLHELDCLYGLNCNL